MSEHIHVNHGPLCRLCRDGKPSGMSATTRVQVNGVMICPKHDVPLGHRGALPPALQTAVGLSNPKRRAQ